MRAALKSCAEPAAQKTKPAGRVTSRRGSSLNLPSGELNDLLRHAAEGIAFTALESLAANTGLGVAEVAALIDLSGRTLSRRKAMGRLEPQETEKLLALATIVEKAVRLFEGDTPEAMEWLRQPKKALGGATPLSFSRTHLGAREVENLIGRLEHGVFS